LKKNWLLFTIICSLITTYLYFLTFQDSYEIVRYSYRVGQIADRDIIAPFSFEVLKSDEAIEKEKEIIANQIEIIYRVSDDIKFNTIRKIDSFMEKLAVSDDRQTIEDKQRFLLDSGYNLSLDTLIKLSDNRIRLDIYNQLVRSLNQIMDIGIYNPETSESAILLSSNGRIRRLGLNRLYSMEEAHKKTIDDLPNENTMISMHELLPHFLTPNIVVDTDLTNQALQEAFKQINPVFTEVLENEEIIRKNRRISELDLRKLDAMTSIYRDYIDENELPRLLTSTVGYFFFVLTLLIGGLILFSVCAKDFFEDFKHYLIYWILFLLLMIMTFAVANIPQAPTILLPLSLATIIITLIFKPMCGFIFNSIALLAILPFFNWNIVDTGTMFMATIIIIIVMTKMKDNHDFIPLSVYLVISFLFVASMVSLITNNDLQGYLHTLLFGTISCLLTIAGVVILSPIIEKKLNLATKMILLELLDTNNPLMKKMAIETPGTFHHSMTVGILAESAAEAIGANALLARVASYYHDIGKLENPQIFIENNNEAKDIHETMDYEESAVNIKNHVLEGISLAKKFKLPQQIIDIIQQHHGDSKVAYFYNKAQESNTLTDESPYKYFGPKPQTKEAALVMIADIVESTAKVQMHSHTEESLMKIIDDTIRRLIIDNQLSEAPITLKELETIKSFMLPIILGIYRKRIEYPKPKDQQ